jgi:hypothetical protein
VLSAVWSPGAGTGKQDASVRAGAEDLETDAMSSTGLDIILTVIAAAAAGVAARRSVLAGRQAREARELQDWIGAPDP